MAQAGALNSAAFNAVIAEARSRDLLVSFGDAPSEVPWKYLHIAGRPCQVSRTSLIHTSQEYVEATSLPIYLPRTSFADFVIYVPMNVDSTDFYVVPRGALSKDTCLTPASLEQYKNAWHLLSQVSLDMMMRRNNRLSWQLQSVILAAESRGLQFEMIRTAKGKSRKTNFRTFHQRRIIIEGKRCAIYSASEVIGTKTKECRVIVVKAPRDDWADFRVHLTKFGITYVVPRGHIPKTTTLSLNSPVLIPYENAWDLLARSG
jgi:hypothetical protein